MAPSDRPSVHRARPGALEVCIIAGVLGMIVVAALTWAGDQVAPRRLDTPSAPAP